MNNTERTNRLVWVRNQIKITNGPAKESLLLEEERLVKEIIKAIEYERTHYGPVGRKTLVVEPLPYRNGEVIYKNKNFYLIHKARSVGATTMAIKAMRGITQDYIYIDELSHFMTPDIYNDIVQECYESAEALNKDYPLPGGLYAYTEEISDKDMHIDDLVTLWPEGSSCREICFENVSNGGWRHEVSPDVTGCHITV
jgi:hypothetical protein